MRGEHQRHRRDGHKCRGIIPACAGNTNTLIWPAMAHVGSSPHARGTPVRPSFATNGARDHPRMRGEHAEHDFVAVGNLGIIPACAGNTDVPFAKDLREVDHPRMRGEHPSRPCRAGPTSGIIPACAGNTPPIVTHLWASAGSSPHARGTLQRLPQAAHRPWDHPRMRGEHHVADSCAVLDKGIIPACAGNTLIYLRSQFPAWQFCITLSKATGLVPLACIAPA